jgi:hypothetical protein
MYVLLAFDNGEPDIWFYLSPGKYKKKKKNGRLEPQRRACGSPFFFPLKYRPSE